MDFHVAVPGPFTYLVHEHARSIIAIQELQQEVTSLLEFRDHVLEALPHLHHHHHHHHSLAAAPSHDPPPAPRPAPPPTTRAEASPSKTGEGARQQQQQRQISSAGGGGGGNSSSSSTGGKSLSETHSSSAVADSGFSTDKAGGSMGKSSSSSAGEHLSGAEDHRWTSVEPEVPLGSAEDELWQLLDVIQRKGTRLRHELERAERAERARLSTGTPPPHHHHHHHTAPASDPLTSPRHPPPAPTHAHTRDYWPHSLPGPTAADLLPPPPPPHPVGVALEAEAWAAVERLRQDRQYLVGRVGWAEAEAAASHQRLVDLHGQLMALAGDKRRLEDQVRALRLDSRPDAPAATSRGVGGGAGVNTVTIMTDHAPTLTPTPSRPRRPPPAVTVSVAGQDPSEDAQGASGRGRGLRSASSVRLNTDRDVVLPRVLKVPIKDRTPRPAPTPAPQEEDGASGGVRRGSDRVVIERERRAGRADGGFSMPVSLLKGARLRVAPNKQRISAILREKDVLELQRQLLTTVMEAEVLRKQIESASEEWAAKTSEWETDRRLTLAAVTTLKEENSKLKEQLEEGAQQQVVEQREVGVSASPVLVNTGTMTTGGGAGPAEEATHTVHPGPNVKYDVVVHQEGGPGRRGGAGVVEKPPRRSREPRNATSPAPPQREAAESPGGRDSLGRGSGSRARLGLSQSGRGTPTGTPRSSPAPSITPRICTARASPQEPPRAAPLSRSSSGAGVRSTMGRRDSLKAAQAKAAAAGNGKASGGAATAAGQHKVAPARCADKSGVGQPRPVREVPRSPLTLADLRTPSATPAPTPVTRPTVTRKVGVRSVAGRRILHHKEAGGAGVRRTPSPGARRVTDHGSRGIASPQELRMSHLAPACPSPAASCSSYYDSINSEGTPASPDPAPGPAPDRVMQVEVAFEWSPVSPHGEAQTHLPSTQVWSPCPASPWPHSSCPASSETPRPWPPDSLEGAGADLGFEAMRRMRSQLVDMNGAARSTPGATTPSQGRSPGLLLLHPQGLPGGGGGAPKRVPAPHTDQDLNSRVHQILARIASGGH